MVTKGENSHKSSMTGSSLSEKIPLIDPAQNGKNKAMKITPERLSSQSSYSNEARIVRRSQDITSEQHQSDGKDFIGKSSMVLAPKGRKHKARKSFESIINIKRILKGAQNLFSF